MSEQTDHPNIQSDSDITQLMVLSAGTYGLVWFWKAWTEVKIALKLQVSPGWRAIFSNFTIHTLARDINWLAVQAKARSSLKPYALLTAAWLAGLISVVVDNKNNRLILLTVGISIAIETYIIVIMQRKLNEYFLHSKPVTTDPKNTIIYSTAIIAGVLSWLGILGSIYGAITGTNPLNK